MDYSLETRVRVLEEKVKDVEKMLTELAQASVTFSTLTNASLATLNEALSAIVLLLKGAKSGI